MQLRSRIYSTPEGPVAGSGITGITWHQRFLDPKDSAGVAAAVKADPAVALKIASRIATLSAATPSQGAGVAKTASAKASADESDPDGWRDCVS